MRRLGERASGPTIVRSEHDGTVARFVGSLLRWRVQGMASLFQAATDDSLGEPMDDEDAETIAGTVDTVAEFIESTRGSAPSGEDSARLDEAIADLERRTHDMRDGNRHGYQETAVVTILLRQLQLAVSAAAARGTRISP